MVMASGVRAKAFVAQMTPAAYSYRSKLGMNGRDCNRGGPVAVRSCLGRARPRRRIRIAGMLQHPPILPLSVLATLSSLDMAPRLQKTPSQACKGPLCYIYIHMFIHVRGKVT